MPSVQPGHDRGLNGPRPPGHTAGEDRSGFIGMTPLPIRSQPLPDLKRHAKGGGRREEMAGRGEAGQWQDSNGGKGPQCPAGVCDPSGSPGISNNLNQN